jgi:pimeloyl-ACP methyl ester carboxylesterase
MDNSKVAKGVCVGNDFGAQVCWEAGRSRPDRFNGVFNVGVPVSIPSRPRCINTALHEIHRYRSIILNAILRAEHRWQFFFLKIARDLLLAIWS